MKFVWGIACLALSGVVLGEGVKQDVDELKIDNTRQSPCDSPSKSGDLLTVHYVGTLYSNGQEFDSSRGRGEPFQFTIGQGQVIEGWEVGMLGMCPGDIRVITIPSKMAYGEDGAGGVIPGNSALVFEVEMISINDAEAEPAAEEQAYDDEDDDDAEEEGDEEEGEEGADQYYEDEQEQEL
ncbi:hypothetical protein BASA81_002194 [Batrachochytrium salamandrivorans]|nr:hypothetical protein BASA81_002194 [Batrachochytrium salamandrivorans]